MFFHPGQVKEENEKQDKRPLPPPIMQPKAKVKSTPEPAHGAAGSGAAGSDAAGSDPRSKVERLHAYGIVFEIRRTSFLRGCSCEKTQKIVQN